MRNMKLLRALRSEERGFTLIELLLVILILGVLMGIAVFAVDPFKDRAIEACEDANAAIKDVEDAARAAGVEGDLFAREANCAVPSGGGNGGALASFVSESSADSGTITVSASSGQLLVAFATHRSDTQAVPASHDGYTNRGAVQADSGASASRRGLAVYTRVADGTATDNWTPPSGWTGSRGVLVFAMNTGSAGDLAFSPMATPGDSTLSTSQALAAASHPNSGPALAVAAIMTRQNASDAPASPTGFTWSGVTPRLSVTPGEGFPTNLFAGSTGTTASTFGASASWTGSQHSSGLILMASLP